MTDREPTPPSELPQYRLAEAENERLFRERIVPELLAGRPARDQPVAVVLFAQPGAGKTRSGDAIEELLGGRRQAIRLDSDRYKPYHPAYNLLLKRDDPRLTPATRLDAIAWNQKAQAYARAARADVILDNTANRLDLLRGTLAPFRESGYRIAAFAIAVPESTSRQGILERYLEQRADSGGGRLTPPDRAASSYRRVVEAVAMVEDRRLVDVSAIFRRGLGEASYYNKLRPDGSWKYEPRAAAALEEERARPLPPVEASTFLAVRAQLRAEMPDELRGRFAGELAAIDDLAAPLLEASVGPGGDRGTGRQAGYLLERTRAAPGPQPDPAPEPEPLESEIEAE